MDEYRYTFGIRYESEEHPVAKWVSPKGWLTVMAPDRETADRLARAVVGQDYAFGYSRAEWSGPTKSGRTWAEMYPLGCLARVALEITEEL